MSKPNSPYTTITFRRKFEEMPLLIAGKPGTSPLWFCGFIDGEFEVSFEPSAPESWWISDVWLSSHNNKMGKEAASNTINLHADTDRHFYLIVLDSVDCQLGRRVPEWIEDELALLDIGLPRARDAA